jgi:hypothetical protein
MEDIRHAENLGGLKNGAAIKRETLGIIAVISERSAVKSIPIVEGRIIDKVELDSVLQAAVNDGAEAVSVVKGNGDAGDHGMRILQMRLPVERQVDCDLMTKRGNGTGQGSDDIGKASGFRKGNTLGCSKEDVHGASAGTRTEVRMRAG